GPSSFTLSSPDLPSGWSFAASNVVAWGGAGLGTGIFYVTSPAHATGTESFTVTASDANHTASTTATHGASTCSPASPTLTPTPTTGMTVAAGGTANYLLSFTNNNTSACGDDDTNAIVGLGPVNWTVTPATQSLAIGPGQTTTEEVTVTAPATATGTSNVG